MHLTPPDNGTRDLRNRDHSELRRNAADYPTAPQTSEHQTSPSRGREHGRAVEGQGYMAKPPRRITPAANGPPRAWTPPWTTTSGLARGEGGDGSPFTSRFKIRGPKGHGSRARASRRTPTFVFVQAVRERGNEGPPYPARYAVRGPLTALTRPLPCETRAVSALYRLHSWGWACYQALTV
jgi:hypothetical protein